MLNYGRLKNGVRDLYSDTGTADKQGGSSLEHFLGIPALLLLVPVRVWRVRASSTRAVLGLISSPKSSMGSTTLDTALHDRHVTDDCNAPAKTEKGYAFGSLWPW